MPKERAFKYSNKILVINDFLEGGGAEIVFNHVCDILKSSGFRVTQYAGRNKITKQNSLFSYIFSFKNMSRLEHLLYKESYDIVYLMNYTYSLSPSILLAINAYKKHNPNFRVIYNAHDFHLICPNSGLIYYKKKKIYKFQFPVRISKFFWEKLDHRFGYSMLKKTQWLLAYKIFHLHNVIDLVLCPSIFLCERIREFYPNKKVLLLRNPVGNIPISVNVKSININHIIDFVFWGRLSVEKGLEEFILALKNVSFSYRFSIFGEGPEKENLQRLINENKLQNRILLKGRLSWELMMQEVEKYDIYILSSLWYENAPLSIVEAAAKGLSIFTMEYGGMKELGDIVGNCYYMNAINANEIELLVQKYRKSTPSVSDLSEFSLESFKHNLLKYVTINSE